MALSPEQLTFIDAYLKDAGIRFSDIRAEWTDHVAEAVQARMVGKGKDLTGFENPSGLHFYDAFKGYMVAHKKELQTDFEKLRKARQWQAFGWTWAACKKRGTLLVFIGSYGGFALFNVISGVVFPYDIYFLGIFIAAILTVYFPLGLYRYRATSLTALSLPLEGYGYVLLILFNLNDHRFPFAREYPFVIHAVSAFSTAWIWAFLIMFMRKRKEMEQQGIKT